MTLRLAVVRDYRAEGWPSMDLCADQLLGHLPAGMAAADIAPPFRHTFGRLPRLGGVGFNTDRLLNRYVLLPQHVRRLPREADFVHLADHSYAHLALSLPAGRVGVYCHDLDAFRCVLEPEKDRRPRWFRALVRRLLRGLQRAALVFHNSAQVGGELRRWNLVRPDRLVHAPLGVAAEFTPEAAEPVELPCQLDGPYLLHVGGDMPRKRLDVLLEVFAAVRETQPNLLLVQVGPPWSPERHRQIDRLGIADGVLKLTGLSRPVLAELYRRAAVVLVPSEAEGFGLPVIEALACGAVVVASDLPVLREVGGAAVLFRPVAAIPEWIDAIRRAMHDPTFAPPHESRLAWASRFTWAAHARVIADAYESLHRHRCASVS